MLMKLLKYDLKYELKCLVPVYILALVMPIVLRIFVSLNEMWPILSTFVGILMFVYVLVVGGIFAWTLIVAIKHFYNNLLKDEGYLTNTLPVSRNQIILSKEITCTVTIVVSTLVAIISLFMSFYYGNVKELFETINISFQIQGVDIVNMVYLFIALMLVSYISQMQVFFLAMMFGQTRNTNKVMFSVIYTVIIYTVMQILSLLLLAFLYEAFPTIMQAMMEETATLKQVSEFVALVFGSTLIFTVVAIVVMHLLTVRMANKKLNLE